MDLLFSKYASPFLFIDTMLLNGMFCDSIDEIMRSENDKKTWEFYLHKVFDKSFDEFLRSVETQTNKPSDEQLETTVKNSVNILNGFIPPERGE